MKKPVVLCIMDGYGKNDSDYGNAIAMAKKPNLMAKLLLIFFIYIFQ